MEKHSINTASTAEILIFFLPHSTPKHYEAHSNCCVVIFFANSMSIWSLTIITYVITQSASLMLHCYLILLSCMPDPADNTSLCLTLIHLYWLHLLICMPWKYTAPRFLFNSVSLPPYCFFKRKSMFLASLQEQRAHTHTERKEKSE